MEEQRCIVESINTDTGPVNSAIARLEREIELLREYRIRLVADVVTGKLDVQDATARLPEEAPLVAEVIDDTDIIDEAELAGEKVAA
jgi:type I restriction enzyme S subunit